MAVSFAKNRSAQQRGPIHVQTKGAYQIAVAQVSDLYGAGPETSILIADHA